MKRVAAPMVGGLLTSFVMELLVYPPIYFLYRRRQLPRRPQALPGSLAAGG
jgi:Cu(I)/Ag(I) efflux system membrane protein CusA/SilA